MEQKDIISLIKNRKSEIINKINELRSELRKIRALENSLRNNNLDLFSNSVQSEKHTFKDMIIGVLKLMPDGGTANQILESIQNKYGINIMRSSISPQLSRLKQDGFLDVEKKVWKMTEKKSDYPDFEKL